MTVLYTLAFVAALPFNFAAPAASTGDQHVLVEQPRILPQASSTLQGSVGMDLTGSYGTVAVAFANGTIFNVGRVDGDQTYQEVMRRYSWDNSTHLTPPYTSYDEMFRDAPRESLRRARKAKGLPATDDVGVVAEMLASLRDAAEAFLQHPVNAALAATPNLVALYREDVEDAFEYLSLTSLDRDNDLYPLFREPSAVAAFHNVGLCSIPEDHDACREEMAQMPLTDILTVSFSKDALCVEVTTIASLYYYHALTTIPTSMDFHLGLDATHDNPSEVYYWEAVRDRIMAALLAKGNAYSITDMFLIGEETENLQFRDYLVDALEKVLGYKPEHWHEREPIYAAARGAAEIARRGGYGSY